MRLLAHMCMCTVLSCQSTSAPNNTQCHCTCTVEAHHHKEVSKTALHFVEAHDMPAIHMVRSLGYIVQELGQALGHDVGSKLEHLTKQDKLALHSGGVNIGAWCLSKSCTQDVD